MTLRPWTSLLAIGRGVLLLVCIVLMIPASASGEELTLAPGLTLVTGEEWSSVKPRAGEAAVLNLRGADGRIEGRATITISNQRTAKDALTQLLWNVPVSRPTIFDIAGWPAVTFTREIELDPPEETEGAGPSERVTHVVTLVAVDKTLLRISVKLGSKAGQDLVTRARSLAEGLRITKIATAAHARRSLLDLRAGLTRKRPKARSLPRTARRGGAPLVQKSITFSTSISTGVGVGRELEIAVSPNGEDIVITSNGDRSLTPRDGSIFTASHGSSSFAREVIPTPPVPAGATGFDLRGDLSVARAPSGRFYVSYLGRERFPDVNRDTVSVAVSERDERGSGFSFLSHAVRCTDDNIFTTDQPHIAVDPRVRPGRSDQVYVVWRANQPKEGTTCSGGNGRMLGFDIMLTCSADGGATWPTTVRISEENMYPRVAVGHDGMVYVVWETGRHRTNEADESRRSYPTIFLTKLSSCEDGLRRQFEVGVTDFSGVVSTVPGLDRNNNGNILASPTVAVDGYDHNRVFIAYADETADGNEDILVLGSVDGGETFPLRTTANNPNVPARRFMPWLCAARDQLFVSWYDRRDSSAGTNDRTQYFASYVQPVINGPLRVLRRVREREIPGMPDLQCRIWPFAPRHSDDSDLCTPQPRRAGRCCERIDDDGCVGSGNRCDFNTAGDCLVGETCMTGGGQPKYGDYTGNACVAGRAFLTWASAIDPSNGSELDRTRVFFATADVVTHTTVITSCNNAICGTVVPGNLGELLFNCPRGTCRLVVPVPEMCQSVLNCPGCGPNGLCPREFTFELEGLDPSWAVRVVDEQGRAVHSAVRRTRNNLAAVLQPGKAETINGRVGRYFLVLDRTTRGKRQLPVRLRVTASEP